MEETQTTTLAERLTKENVINSEPSSIINIGESNGKSTNNDLNLNKHYYCQNCNTFPLINFKENKMINLKCEDCEMNITADNYIKFKAKEGGIKNFVKTNPNEIYSGYCFDCKQFFSENNSKEHENHNIKNLNDFKNFIRKRLNIPEIKEEKGEENPEVHNNTSKKNQIGSTINYKEENGKLIQVKKNDNIDNQYSDDPFGDLIEIIINDEKIYPNNAHYENIKNIFYYLSDQMEIEYCSYENHSKDIRIFGHNFVKNNDKNFILFIDGKEEKLKENIQVEDPKKVLKIKLIKINEPTNLSEMFYNCDCLSKIYKIKKWETSKVESIRGMFSHCRALETLPDISEFVTNKITDLSNMFEECVTLPEITGISKWNVENVKSMKEMFSKCESLKKLDLSGWKTNKLDSIDSMFQNCSLLESLKGLEKLDTSQVTNMKSVFMDCFSLTEIKGISEWNTEKVKNFSLMFCGCEFLETVEGISKWNVKNAIKMDNMFENCSNLKTLDTSKWEINSKLDTCFMIKGCDLLKEKPNFIK